MELGWLAALAWLEVLGITDGLAGNTATGIAGRPCLASGTGLTFGTFLASNFLTPNWLDYNGNTIILKSGETTTTTK